MVLQMLLEKDPESEHLRTERMQETLMEIQSRVLSKLGDAKLKLASKDDSGVCDVNEHRRRWRCQKLILLEVTSFFENS